jgi:hypothetical protein
MVKYFDIKNKGFNYNDGKSARYFFVVKGKSEIIFSGPSVKDIKNVKKFKKEHKKVMSKKDRLYAVEKMNLGIKEFIKKWEVKNSGKIKDMSISGIRII